MIDDPNRTLSGIHPLLDKRLQAKFLPRWHEQWNGKFLVEAQHHQPAAIRLDGNDYLSLTGHHEIVSAQIESLKNQQEEVVQSGIFHQEDHPSRVFEKSLASWLGKTDGVLCQSGYMANVGLLQAIADADTPVYIDMLAHASLWEGIHAARATAYAFRHNDVSHLRRQIQAHGPGIVVVDSVYSTTGALCPLEAVVQTAEEHGCIIIVDESHSLGTHGPGGSGLCQALGLSDRVHFITASLAKAFAARAGYFTVPSNSHWQRYYFLSESFPNIFSSSLLNHEIAALSATLRVIQGSDHARQTLQSHTVRMRQFLNEMGYPIHQGTEQIIALEVGSEPAVDAVRNALESRGIVGAIFCAPATASQRAMVRLTLNAGLTEVELEQLEMRFKQLLPFVKPHTWSAALRRSSPYTRAWAGSLLSESLACLA